MWKVLGLLLACPSLGENNVSAGEAGLSLRGKYQVEHVTYQVPVQDVTDRTVHVWHPIALKGEKFPLISYAHGFAFGGPAERLEYGDLLDALASFGYVVAAPEACQWGCSDAASLPFDPPGFKNYYKQQLKTLEWAKEQASKGVAPFSSIDVEIGVGIAGHSMGGQATVFSSSESGAGHDIKAAVMHHAFTHVFPAPTVPFLAMTGTTDTIAPPSMTTGFYNAKGAHPTRGLVNRAFTDHLEPDPGPSFNPKLARITAAWFKIHLDKKPQEGEDNWDDLIFGTGPSGLCHGYDGKMQHCEVHRGTESVVV